MKEHKVQFQGGGPNNTMINYKELEKIIDEATPGPWGPYTANLPFYAIVTKPAPSLSKHDPERPTYWRIEDAKFVAMAREVLPELIEENKRLREALIGLMIRSRECADDEIYFENDNYSYWYEQSRAALEGK